MLKAFLCVFYVTIWGQKSITKNENPALYSSRYGNQIDICTTITVKNFDKKREKNTNSTWFNIVVVKDLSRRVQDFNIIGLK